LQDSTCVFPKNIEIISVSPFRNSGCENVSSESESNLKSGERKTILLGTKVIYVVFFLDVNMSIQNE
jgi:hypothetical protein